MRLVLPGLALVLFGCTEAGDARDVAEAEVAATDAVADTVEGTETVAATETAEPTETVASEVTDTLEDEVTGPVACEPALSLEPAESWTFVFGGVSLQAGGGSGAYRFAVGTDASGMLLNGLTGAYIAGGETGDDVVHVSDLGCIGEASAVVHVVPPMVVSPAIVKLPPGTAFTPEVVGGSGQVDVALADPDSAATLDGMTYTAGDSDGFDDLVVVDRQTGQRETVRVVIETGASLVARPVLVQVPVGHRFRYAALGGSGRFDGLADVAGIVAEADGWRVDAAGTYDVELVDHFTGQRVAQRVVGVAPLFEPVILSGTSTFHYTALGPGDLDGDGYPEAVVGIGDANVARYQSGGVFVYAGVAGGLDPTPRLTLSSPGREDNSGRTVVVADLDGDGRKDLAYGSFRADPNNIADAGAVYVHRGIAGPSYFEEEPVRVFGGPFSGDNLGYSLAACDFDGDGHVDLAAGAWMGEDRTLNPLLSNQGVVHVFRGQEGDFPDTSYLVPGVAGDGWAAAANARAGTALAAGDFDGDGYCDLANANYQWTNVNSNDGFVQVFRGGPDGLELVPSFAVVSASVGGARIGMWLAAGDVDGDSIDDLAIASGYWNKTNTDRTGRARLFLGGERFAGPVVGWGAIDDADLTLEGVSSNDYVGYQVAIGDVTGDGLDDLAVSGWMAECAGCPSNGGRIDVHAGRLGELPDVVPTWSVGGNAAEDRQGSALAIVGDGLVVGVAGLDDTLGPDVPRAWALRADGSTPLGMTGGPGGWRIGVGVTVLPDLDGDGRDELAVGAPNEAARRTNGSFHLQGGAVQVYAGTADGFGAAPAYTLQDFTGHSGSDGYGFGLAATDFDKDGDADLIVVARFEDAPSSFAAATYTTIGTCPTGARNNSGAIYVHPGNAGRVDLQPAFVKFGATADQTLERAITLDLNGDGYGDVVTAAIGIDAPGRSDAGGFEVVLGRVRVDAKINVVCVADATWTGVTGGDNGGSSLTVLGDIDADGCEDFAVGAWTEDGGVSNQGAVRVFFGWGLNCASAIMRAATLVPGASEDRAGQSLAAADLDGDGRRELIVGGTTHRVNGIAMGAAWIVDGRRLATLQAEELQDGVAPSLRAPLVEATTARVEGVTRDEAFGFAVAGDDGIIAVASQASDASGPAAISLVRVFRVDGLVIDPDPLAVLGGESEHTRAMRDANLTMFHKGGVPWLAIGESEANGLALDSGAVYVAPLVLP